MTTQLNCAGAASGNSTQWQNINWLKCNREAKRLQARIVKATREGRWGKVKSLQWLLTHSFSGKAISVKRITENKGSKTSGVDNILWNTPRQKIMAIHDLKRRGYKPKPLRRIYILKSNGEQRPLGIPTMKDRAMQMLHLLALYPISETTGDKNSYGFRPERSTADAIEQCFKALGRRDTAEWILEADIESCFDKINHQWLLDNIYMDKKILNQWLKCGYVENTNLFATESGTPQGGIVSPTLANLALDGLEELLSKKFYRTEKNGRRWNPKIHLARYADDFIIAGLDKELLEDEVKPVVIKFLAERGLSLSEEKTNITHIEAGFDFLGQNIRKYNGKLLIKPSTKSYKQCIGKTRETIKRNKTAKQSTIIRLLNPIITGWSNFHCHVVAKGSFE